VVEVAAAGLLASITPAGAKPAAVAASGTPIVWIAAQVNPLDVGLDPVASQISRDGSVVGFVTAWSAIDPGDILLDADVFEYRVASGLTQRINVTPGSTTYGNGWLDSFSADGSVLSFTTGAALVPDDTNGAGDVYVVDRNANRSQRVSVDGAGQQSIDASGSSAVSADGALVAFAGDLSAASPTDRQIWLPPADRTAGGDQRGHRRHGGRRSVRARLDVRRRALRQLLVPRDEPARWRSAPARPRLLHT
jgi:hypothetical protein